MTFGKKWVKVVLLLLGIVLFSSVLALPPGWPGADTSSDSSASSPFILSGGYGSDIHRDRYEEKEAKILEEIFTEEANPTVSQDLWKTSILEMESIVECENADRAGPDGSVSFVMGTFVICSDTGIDMSGFEGFRTCPTFLEGGNGTGNESDRGWTSAESPRLVDLLSESDPRYWRFESDENGCRKTVTNRHTFYGHPDFTPVEGDRKPTDDDSELPPIPLDPQTPLFDPFGFTGFSTDSFELPQQLYYYDVNWDSNKADCEIIGGDFLDPNDAGVSSTSLYNGRLCCGDDTIWVLNAPLNYDPTLTTNDRRLLSESDALCLYSRTPDYGNSIPQAEGGYLCDPAAENTPYDPNLRLDDPEKAQANSTDPFYFVDDAAGETDVGKWSDINDENPIYCYSDFDPQNGVKYEWLTIAEAGDRDAITCERNLGYNWTGSRCCGNDGVESYNDPEGECLLSEYISGVCTDTAGQEFKTFNKACWKGKAIDDYKTFSSTLVKKDVLNDNGTFYGCTSEAGSLPIGGSLLSSGSANVPKCTVQGPAFCAFVNDSWMYLYDEQGGLLSSGINADVFGLRNNDFRLTQSTVPGGFPRGANYTMPTECCFSGGCWNGSACMDEFTEVTVNNATSAYICNNGRWTSPVDAKYNWDYDTRLPEYCELASSCACSSDPGSSYFCACDSASDDCNFNYMDRGCTTVNDFFAGDHICQDGEWSSRTKLLAMHLLQLAQGKDFSLFCDTYDNALFDTAMLGGQLSVLHNNFCAITFDGKTVIGSTFNPGDSLIDTLAQDALAAADGTNSSIITVVDVSTTAQSEVDPLNFDLEEILFNPASFVSIVLEDDAITACSAAFGNSGLDTFYSCDSSNNLYVNDGLKAFLYSTDAISQSSQLSVNADSTFATYIDPEISEVLNLISTSQDAIEDQVFSIGFAEHTSDFDTLYLSRKGSRSAFGIIESKYDPVVEDIRSYLALVYRSVPITCTDLEVTYPSAYCTEQNGATIVIDRTAGDFDKWIDFTSTLRLG